MFYIPVIFGDDILQIIENYFLKNIIFMFIIFILKALNQFVADIILIFFFFFFFVYFIYFFFFFREKRLGISCDSHEMSNLIFSEKKNTKKKKKKKSMLSAAVFINTLCV